MICRLRRSRRVSAIVAALAVVVAGCGDSGTLERVADPSGPQTSVVVQLSGSIKGSGASFPDSFYQEATAGLAQVAPDLRVTYESVGSSAGKEAFSQGLSDFAGSDSLVADKDGIDPAEFFYIPSTAASISVIYNLPGIDELRLDGPTVARIFQRDIARWDDAAIAELNPDVELPAIEITVARRADGAGTTKNFTKYLDAAAPDVWRLGNGDTVEWPAATQGGSQNPGVAQIVTDAVGGIGYLDYGNAVELGIDAAAIRNREGSFVAPSVEATTAALDGAELAEDLTYDPLDGPGADAYPITAPTYVLVRTSYGDERRGRAVVEFVKWLITDGADTYAADVGFAPVPESFRDAAFARLDEVRIGGDPR